MNIATVALAAFAAGLRFEDLPEPVVRGTEKLLVDWFGSAVAGHGARPVMAIAAFARAMGPATGPSETLADRGSNSPWLAALCNAAASHVAEQDDVHNGAVFHPATVVFPPALAVAQALGASGADFLAACVAGYEVGIRVGEFLGRSHYKVFHTTGTAGTLAAAAAVGKLLLLDAAQMQHAFGSAGTQSAGLWEFLRTGADSKQLHTAHAASAGLLAAYLARDGFTGMMAIHPAQVATINAAFSPTDEEVAQARAIIAAFAANPGAGAVQLDGKMIDAPHRKAAEKLLARMGDAVS